MGISLNPLDLVKLFQDRGIHDRELMVTYVQEIADSAKQLADHWCETIAAIPTVAQKHGKPVAKVFGRQAYLCSKIENFYRDASQVIDTRIKREQRERLYEVLGQFMENRNRTTAIHCEAIQEYLNTKSRSKEPEILEEARQLANSLQANAGELQSLASQIRAMK